MLPSMSGAKAGSEPQQYFSCSVKGNVNCWKMIATPCVRHGCRQAQAFHCCNMMRRLIQSFLQACHGSGPVSMKLECCMPGKSLAWQSRREQQVMPNTSCLLWVLPSIVQAMAAADVSAPKPRRSFQQDEFLAERWLSHLKLH